MRFGWGRFLWVIFDTRYILGARGMIDLAHKTVAETHSRIPPCRIFRNLRLLHLKKQRYVLGFVGESITHGVILGSLPHSGPFHLLKVILCRRSLLLPHCSLHPSLQSGITPFPERKRECSILSSGYIY